MPELDPELVPVLPRTAAADGAHLSIGGCDAVTLAAQFGTPLYVFDEEELRESCRDYREAFTSRYANSAVVYASKAYLAPWIAALMEEEGMGLDVVSGGELAVARRAGFPMERVLFHGNNKSEQELREALGGGIQDGRTASGGGADVVRGRAASGGEADAPVGRIVIDNFHELAMLERIAGELGVTQRVLVRVSPNIDAHTHVKTTTGVLDTKFGFTLEARAISDGGTEANASDGDSSQAEEAVRLVMASPHLELMGLHCHLGSPIYGLEPHVLANDVMIAFAREMRDRHGLELREYSPGGGFAMQYVRDQPAPSTDDYAEAVVGSLRQALEREGLPEPRLTVEPGRSIVARAGVALYTVGARKEMPGVRTYVSVDGGMADNIRPAMYDARYEALVANRVGDAPEERVTVAGKYCESGDVLLRDVELPRLEAGDLLALPGSGAYCLSMASNYNHAPRPAAVLVRDGEARLVRRRETYDDMMQADVWEE